MTKAEKIAAFDPNGAGDPNSNIYGLPFTSDEAETVVIPIPWDVTVSYSDGTANGPEAILEASYQVDLFDPYVADAWKAGIALDQLPRSEEYHRSLKQAEQLRAQAKLYIDALLDDGDPDKDLEMGKIRSTINAASDQLNAQVEERTKYWLDKGKCVALLGGDHSTPYGFMKALASKYSSYGILQIDAHADLREAFEGFTFSHASIMYNALGINQVSKLVQVGIRDFCQAEAELIAGSKGRVVTFFDRDIKHAAYAGRTWAEQCKLIVAELPEIVYISFDIDGLDPKLCPNTGTPVAGGFEFEQALFLIQQVVESNRTIIGLDLNEVAPDPTGGNEWDANVGARLLMRMCNLMARSQKKI
jgi:agmatinase